ncbi:VOC family protein [Sorangium sp. So ce117]|uniref:VOC family protein n=1 Tax=Sorangium sp. So ce117 TaxID=3133277 RepID=UPI003F63A576
MQLNHIDLQVPDVLETAAFFERHFQFEVHGNRHSPAIAILTGPGDFTLVLQRRREADGPYPEGFHIGFIVGDLATVYDKHAAIVAAGIDSGPVSENGRGVMFYFKAPGDILIEVSCRRRPLPAVRAGAGGTDPG